MSILQSNYRRDHERAAAGIMSTTTHNDVDSLVVEENSRAIPFGYVVAQGANEKECKRGGVTSGDQFVGIAVVDETAQPSNNDTFVTGNVVNTLIRGDVWVPVGGSVRMGGAVRYALPSTFNATSSGRINGMTAAADNPGIPGARFMSGPVTVTSSTGETETLAMVRLTGEQRSVTS